MEAQRGMKRAEKLCQEGTLAYLNALAAIASDHDSRAGSGPQERLAARESMECLPALREHGSKALTTGPAKFLGAAWSRPWTKPHVKTQGF